VRNPKFSLAFTHPRTIRAGEPYTESVTLLNTSLTPANLVSVTLPEASLSGAIFEPGTPEVAELGTILPARRRPHIRLRAQRTVRSLELTSDATSSAASGCGWAWTSAACRSPIDRLPEFADDCANSRPRVPIERYLGQALSAATAAQLPPASRTCRAVR
jgi:hypothetical protein